MIAERLNFVLCILPIIMILPTHAINISVQNTQTGNVLPCPGYLSIFLSLPRPASAVIRQTGHAVTSSFVLLFQLSMHDLIAVGSSYTLPPAGRELPPRTWLKVKRLRVRSPREAGREDQRSNQATNLWRGGGAGGSCDGSGLPSSAPSSLPFFAQI